MKYLIAIMMLAITGCASNQVRTSQAISYEQLASTKVSSRDCPNIDTHVNFIEQQLRFKGLLNATPEDLNEDDRKYNATARIMIWSLRIGCNNPNRYKL